MVLPSGDFGRSLTPIIRGCDGAVDVGVEQAGALALAGERHGEVGGDGRLADAALAASRRR